MCLGAGWNSIEQHIKVLPFLMLPFEMWKWYLIKHSIKNNHLPVVKSDFTILGSGYRSKTRKKKIAEVIIIKVIRPSLNSKEKSVELKLFNWTSFLHTKCLFKVYTRNIAWDVGHVQIWQQWYHSLFFRGTCV